MRQFSIPDLYILFDLEAMVLFYKRINVLFFVQVGVSPVDNFLSEFSVPAPVTPIDGEFSFSAI